MTDLNEKTHAFNNCSVSYLLFKSTASRGIIFFFPGAYDRSKGTTQFQRHSWHVDYVDNYTCVYIDDPTINDDNDLTIGWFQGWKGVDVIGCVASLIKKIQLEESVKEENIIFFGSSAGGFVSLKLSNIFRKSTVIAINPQIYLNKFFPRLYTEMLDYSYPDFQVNVYNSDLSEKISYFPEFSNRVGCIFIFQNTADNFHYINHTSALLDSISEKKHISVSQVKSFDEKLVEKNHLNFIFYEDRDRGHNPPVQKDTKKLMNMVFDFL